MKTEKEIWAIVDKNTGEVVWSVGGSSTPSKLMIYPSLKRAESGLRLSRTRFRKEYRDCLEVRKIYNSAFSVTVEIY